MKKKLFSAFLMSIILLLAVLTACHSSNSTDSKNTSSSNGTSDVVTTSPYDDKGFLRDNIPSNLNYGGREVNILVSKEQSPRIGPEESSTDTLSRVTYERNKKIEERLNIKLNFIKKNGSWTTRNEFIDEAVRANAAGNGEYDLIGTFSLIPSVLAARGILINLMELEFPQFDMPWWPEEILKGFMFYNSIFFVTDNSSGNLLREMFVTYYNRDTIEAYHLEDPTQLTIEGKWTLDKLEELSRGLYQDLNNNGSVDEEDQFGLVVDDHSRLDAYFYGSDLNIIRVNDEGNPEFTFDTEKDKILRYLDKMISIYRRRDSFIDKDSRKILQDGRTAFFTACLAWIEIVDTQGKYGIVPVSKFSEAQEKYRTIFSNAIDVWCIPNDVNDDELSGIILEAIASGSYRLVAPNIT